MSHYPTKDCTAKSLKRKIQELACTKVLTGGPNYPPYVCNANPIYYKIAPVTDGSMDQLEDGGDLDNERDGAFEWGQH